jgi:hypothetical protein
MVLDPSQDSITDGIRRSRGAAGMAPQAKAPQAQYPGSGLWGMGFATPGATLGGVGQGMLGMLAKTLEGLALGGIYGTRLRLYRDPYIK